MKQKMGFRKSRFISASLIITGAISVFLSTVFSGLVNQILFYPGIAAVGVGVIIRLANSICPHCDRQIDIRGISPDYCPYCGNRLE